MYKILCFLILCGTYAFGAIYDCFLFFNEFELLEIRLHELSAYVDYFVIVEGEETFKGEAKPLRFELQKERYADFADKIIYIPVQERVLGCNWTREGYQRNQIMRGLTACSPDDIILLSDVDEIPKGKSISQAIEMLEDGKKAVSFQQVMYRFFINRQDPLMWLGSLATTYQVMKETNNPEELRRDRTDYGGYQRGEWASIEDGGWHFTSMGGFSRV